MLSNEITEQPLLTPSEQAGLTPIKDDGHIVLKCSSCGKELVDIWVTHKEMPVKTTLVAECCFCGDKSFEKSVDGVFHLGDVDRVAIVDFTNNSDKYYIRTQAK